MREVPVATAGEVEGGNNARQAPEVHLAFKARRAKIDYTGQPVFEVGQLLWELVTLQHPIDNYPLILSTKGMYTKDDVCMLPRTSYEHYRSVGYTDEFAALIRRMVAFSSRDRPSLAAAYEEFCRIFEPYGVCNHAAALSSYELRQKQLHDNLTQLNAVVQTLVQQKVRFECTDVWANSHIGVL